MTVKYARTAGGNWSANATWSLSSGGAADTVAPTAADDCILDSNSGNVTIDTGAVCRSLDCTSGTGTYAGVLTHNASVTLEIGDATAGAGNIALKFTPGMTYTLGNATTSSLRFRSSSATLQTVDLASKTVANVTFGLSTPLGGNHIFAAGQTVNSAANITHTHGSVDLNDLVFIGAGVNTSWVDTTPVFDLGESQLTLSSTGNGFSISDSGTAATLTAGTSIITLTGTAGRFFLPGTGYTFNTVILAGAGVQRIAGGGSTFTNLTRSGTNATGNELSIESDFTVSNTLTLNGAAEWWRLFVRSSSLTVSRTITANGTIVASNVDFRRITGAGTASWNLFAIPGGSGNCGDNSGITFTSLCAGGKSGIIQSHVNTRPAGFAPGNAR